MEVVFRNNGHRQITPQLIRELRLKAKNIRRNVLFLAEGKGEGYVGQGLGSADILKAVYFHEMRYDPRNPDWPDRDRFLLSTGHYSIVLYAALTELGVFPQEELSSYGEDESHFGMSTIETTPGVEITGGSLGHGLSQAVGMAIGSRLSGRDFRVFNLLSDGELQEGSTWEAATSAAHYKLDNLVALEGLVTALDTAREVKDQPQVIVCYTLMGKGVPFVEERPKGHFVRVIRTSGS